MKINKYILKKELLIELKNSSSLFLITPTMSVLIIIFPILKMAPVLESQIDCMDKRASRFRLAQNTFCYFLKEPVWLAIL